MYLSLVFLPSFTYNKCSAGHRRCACNIVPRRETHMMATSTISATDQRIRNATINRKMFFLQESDNVIGVKEVTGFDTFSACSVLSIDFEDSKSSKLLDSNELLTAMLRRTIL